MSEFFLPNIINQHNSCLDASSQSTRTTEPRPRWWLQKYWTRDCRAGHWRCRSLTSTSSIVRARKVETQRWPC